jgi:hypothetical protein
MRFHSLLAALVGSLVAGTASPGGGQPSIGGVALGDDRQAVIGRLGEPQRTIHTGDSLDPQLEYDGLTIWLWEGQGVAQIRSTSPKYCLSAMVCPGISASSLRMQLGKPMNRPDVVEGRNEFALNAEACWLEATVSLGVLTTLEIKCQP